MKEPFENSNLNKKRKINVDYNTIYKKKQKKSLTCNELNQKNKKCTSKYINIESININKYTIKPDDIIDNKELEIEKIITFLAIKKYMMLYKNQHDKIINMIDTDSIEPSLIDNTFTIDDINGKDILQALWLPMDTEKRLYNKQVTDEISIDTIDKEINSNTIKDTTIYNLNKKKIIRKNIHMNEINNTIDTIKTKVSKEESLYPINNEIVSFLQPNTYQNGLYIQSLQKCIKDSNNINDYTLDKTIIQVSCKEYLIRCKVRNLIYSSFQKFTKLLYIELQNNIDKQLINNEFNTNIIENHYIIYNQYSKKYMIYDILYKNIQKDIDTINNVILNNTFYIDKLTIKLENELFLYYIGITLQHRLQLLDKYITKGPLPQIIGPKLGLFDPMLTSVFIHDNNIKSSMLLVDEAIKPFDLITIDTINWDSYLVYSRNFISSLRNSPWALPQLISSNQSVTYKILNIIDYDFDHGATVSSSDVQSTILSCYRLVHTPIIDLASESIRNKTILDITKHNMSRRINQNDMGEHLPNFICHSCKAMAVYSFKISERRSIAKAETWGTKSGEGMTIRYNCNNCGESWIEKDEY